MDDSLNEINILQELKQYVINGSDLYDNADKIFVDFGKAEKAFLFKKEVYEIAKAVIAKQIDAKSVEERKALADRVPEIVVLRGDMIDARDKLSDADVAKRVLLKKIEIYSTQCDLIRSLSKQMREQLDDGKGLEYGR